MASLNDTTPKNALRRPKMQVLVAGKPVQGLMYASITSTNNFQCDKFTIDFSLWLDKEQGPKFWDKDTIEVDVQVSVGLNGAADSFQSILKGLTDKVNVKWFEGIVQITGRDKTSLLIDNKTFKTYQNQTSSQVVTELAKARGLQIDVDQTDTKVGSFYNHDKTRHATGEFNRSQTEWDLITFLAQQEGFDVWVKGDTLHFKKRVKQDPTPWSILLNLPEQKATNLATHKSTTIQNITLQRSLTLAKDIRVELTSWDTAHHKHTKVTSGPPGNKAQVRQYPYPPNRPKDEMQKYADEMREDLSRNERLVEWKEPGVDDKLTCRNMVALTGTTTSFDNQPYHIQEIIRTYSINEGLFMTVKAKNHSTESETGLSSVSG